MIGIELRYVAIIPLVVKKTSVSHVKDRDREKYASTVLLYRLKNCNYLFVSSSCIKDSRVRNADT